MSEINTYDATEGCVAVKPMKYLVDGRGSCYGCEFNDNVYQSCYGCASYSRADHQDVIFKPAG